MPDYILETYKGGLRLTEPDKKCVDVRGCGVMPVIGSAQRRGGSTAKGIENAQRAVGTVHQFCNDFHRVGRREAKPAVPPGF